MPEHKAFEQLTPSEKCVINGYVKKYAPRIEENARIIHGELSKRELADAVTQARDLLLAFYKPDDLIKQLDTPEHTDHAVLDACRQRIHRISPSAKLIPMR